MEAGFGTGSGHAPSRRALLAGLTGLAEAVRLKPRIAGRLKLIEHGDLLPGDDGGYIPVPGGRPQRIYTGIDTRLTFADMFAKFAAFS